MRKIAENIYEHNGIKVEAVKVVDKMPCMKCPFACNACQVDFKCSELIGRMEFVPYQEIQENSMKKSELSFKCVLGSPARNKKMYDAIMRAGIKNHIREEDFVKTAMCLRIDDTWNNEVSPTYAGKITESYESAPIPEVSFETALKMLESVEPDAPEFDIKPFDRILARGANGSEWLARLYEANGSCNFIETGGCFCNQLIKYDGNEHLHRTVNPAAGWWECENGNPVWRTK
jgi:hypothetical protein